MNSKKSIIIAAAVVIIVGAASFFGGTVYEKDKLSSQGVLRSGNGQSASGQQRRQSAGGAGGPAGQSGGNFRPGGQGANGGSFLTGQVIAKDDKSITVKTPDGGSKIVYFSDSTSVGKSVQGSVSDLANGDQVMVGGTNSSDGTFAAQNIQIRPVQQQP
ncbi:MAG: hypothetical protein WC858_05620 [Parcubacteria group bacterium]|jgi:hypothetical protein